MPRWSAYVEPPWRHLRQAYRWFRRTFFTTSKPDGPFLVVDEDIEDLERTLGQQSWAPNWEFSYNYKSEDLNLARVEYGPHSVRVGTGLSWWQYHVRGWEREDGLVELRCHWEPEPTEHPDAHLDGVGYSLEGGMNRLREVLEDAGVGILGETER